MAQIVWFHGENQIQLAEVIPAGRRAAIIRHFLDEHEHECCTRACSDARDWVREFAGGVCASQTA